MLNILIMLKFIANNLVEEFLNNQLAEVQFIIIKVDIQDWIHQISAQLPSLHLVRNLSPKAY